MHFILFYKKKIVSVNNNDDSDLRLTMVTKITIKKIVVQHIYIVNRSKIYKI